VAAGLRLRESQDETGVVQLCLSHSLLAASNIRLPFFFFPSGPISGSDLFPFFLSGTGQTGAARPRNKADGSRGACRTRQGLTSGLSVGNNGDWNEPWSKRRGTQGPDVVGGCEETVNALLRPGTSRAMSISRLRLPSAPARRRLLSLRGLFIHPSLPPRVTLTRPIQFIQTPELDGWGKVDTWTGFQENRKPTQLRA
jgi:hypothetical protein